jgi:hypothetical protein
MDDTEVINRHRQMTPSERVALTIEVSRAAFLFANARRVEQVATEPSYDRWPVRPDV